MSLDLPLSVPVNYVVFPGYAADLCLFCGDRSKVKERRRGTRTRLHHVSGTIASAIFLLSLPLVTRTFLGVSLLQSHFCPSVRLSVCLSLIVYVTTD